MTREGVGGIAVTVYICCQNECLMARNGGLEVRTTTVTPAYFLTGIHWSPHAWSHAVSIYSSHICICMYTHTQSHTLIY